jgi:hypothetical protein
MDGKESNQKGSKVMEALTTNECPREVRLGLARSLTLAALHEACSSGYRLKYFRLASETRLEHNKFMDRGTMSLASNMFAGITAGSRIRNRCGLKVKK